MAKPEDEAHAGKRFGFLEPIKGINTRKMYAFILF